MTSSDYPEYVAQNVAVWTRNNAKFTGPNARAAWAEEDMSWGVFCVPESELNVYGGRFGSRRPRSRLRHGVPLGVAGEARSATCRRRPYAGAARDGARDAEGVRSRVPARRGASARTCRSPTLRSISSRRSSAPRSGPTPTAGSRRRRACSAPAGGSSSSATRRCRCVCMDLDGATESLQRPQRGLNRIEWPDKARSSSTCRTAS